MRYFTIILMSTETALFLNLKQNIDIGTDIGLNQDKIFPRH